MKSHDSIIGGAGPSARSSRRCALLLCLLLAACGGDGDVPLPATLVVSDARIWTGSPHEPWAEAIASRGDTIVAVGTGAEVTPFIGRDTEVIRATGAMLVPGFIDSHVHFATGGAALASVQLRDADSPDEFTHRIGEFAAGLEPGDGY